MSSTRVASTILVRFGATHRAAVRAEWAAAQAAGLPLIVVDDGTLLLGAAPDDDLDDVQPRARPHRAPGPARDGPRLLRRAWRRGRRGPRSGGRAARGRTAPSARRPRRRARRHRTDRPSTGSASAPSTGTTTTTSRRGCASSSKPTRRPPTSPTCGGAWRRSWRGRPAGRTSSASMAARSSPPGRCSRRTASAGRAGRRSCPPRAVAGIQRALIDARSRLAAEHGCDLVAAWALAGAHSSANLERAGLRTDRSARRPPRRGPTGRRPSDNRVGPPRARHDPGSSAGPSSRARRQDVAAGRGRSAGRRPRHARRRPWSDGRNRSPTVRRNRNVVPATSSTPISSAVSRAGSAARAARSAAVHSARVGSCSMRNGGPSGSRRGAAASRQRDDAAIRSLSLARLRPGRGRNLPSRSRATSASMSSVAIAQVARPCPASIRGRRASAARSTTSAARSAVEDADQLEVGVAEPDQPVERPEPVVPSAPARRQPERRRQLRGRRVRVGDGDHEVVDAGEHRESVAGRPARYDARVSPVSDGYLRVERTGAAGEVARVTLARPEVHNAFDATLIAELRTTFASSRRESPTDLRVVVLAGDGPSFCAGADIDWMRAAMSLDVEGNEQDAMAMADMFEAIDTCPVPVIARVHGAALGGGMGLCAVADLVIAEIGRPVRVHRDAPRDPAVGHQPVRHRQDRREPRAGAVPGRPPVRCHAGGADRARPRDRRGEDALDAAVEAAVGGRAGRRTDRRAGREGDRPRGPRPRPRLGQVAHGAGHRPPADERGGAGGVPRVRREAPPGLGAGPGRGLRIRPTSPGRRQRGVEGLG